MCIRDSSHGVIVSEGEYSEGKKFESAAKKFFDLTKKDFAIGLINKSDLPEKSSKSVFKASLNEVVGPIKTEFGYSIYKIIKIFVKLLANH